MNEKYANIDFGRFTEEPKERLTNAEKKRLLKRFDQSVYAYHKKKIVRKIVAAAAVCVIVCMAVTPLGSSTWAAVKEVCQGIGDYLGMRSEDPYATQIGQTQTKGDITVTLNEAVLSNIELRFSATSESKSGKPPYIDVVDTYINGKKVGEDIVSGGIGSFGSKVEGNKKTCYTGVDAYQEVPDDPRIKMILACGGEWFTFEFTIDNRKFKEDTRTAEINKTIEYKGKTLELKQLTVMPTAQTIEFENPERLDLFNLDIHGTDNQGNEAVFSSYPGTNLYLGFRDSEEGTTYELDHDVSSYTLRLYDLNDVDNDDFWNEKNAISDEFTVKLK